ncbi:hypothetical protein CSPHI_10900 [Corynebacterium sphenisci DSM 44792]|uniref:non-specific protein-tyrosine kinase n=1 Tax=Corynebacterium sphenisci DSM 44792 TaxID=1437874 RepID=A0A1L7D016_9CORY|nr:polysaccharide biosynthesis tyrosine autokinase [Corynebacterium sphenisci]APT91410.1 hypothetical protein CSPHI_10900 [Corynebacterium sphenisci DSM 44792]
MLEPTTVGADTAEKRRPPAIIWIIALVIALPIPFVILRDVVLPGRFAYDAFGIATLIQYPYLLDLYDFGSYADIARAYSAIGLTGRDLIPAGLLGYGTMALSTVIALWRAGRLPRRTSAVALTGATLVLGAAFLGTFSKEFLVAVLIGVVLLIPAGFVGEVLVIAALLAFGALYRPYWTIIAVVYAIIRLILRTARGTRGFWLLVPCTAAALGLMIWLQTGQSADFARLGVNEYRGAETRTLIERFVHWPEPLGGVVNVVITTVMLVVPLPLFALGTIYHGSSALLILFFWVTFGRAIANYGGTRPTGYVARAIALVLAFLPVQGLFEPDYGSALRHLTPLLPLMLLTVIVWAPDGPDDEPTAGDGAPPGREAAPPNDITKNTTNGVPMNEVRSDGSDHIWGRVLSGITRLWWVVVIAAVLGAAAAWGISMLLPKKYTATTDLFVTAAADTGDGQLYKQAQFFQQRLSSYAQLVKGDLLVNRVIGDLDLSYEPETVMNMLEAQPTPDTVLITVSATSADPEEARLMSDAASKQLQILVGELDVRGEVPGESDGAGEQPRTRPREEALTSMTIIDAATTPEKPSSPIYARNMVFGFIFGTILALLGIIAAALLDRTVTKRAEVEDLTGVPVLGEIPSNSAFAAGAVPDYHVDNTPAVEGIRALRTNLRFVDVDNPPKLLAITSATQGEGKTITAVNLAAALAAEGHTVCLVDGDLRRPRVAKALGAAIEPAVGLSTILAGEISLEEAIQKYADRSFDVVASGVNPPNPAELLSSKACRSLLEDLSGRYDFVIIDGPPLLPVTDGALIAAAAGATILVVRHGIARYEEVAAATEALATVNAHLIGTAFNRVPDGSRHGYKYSYTPDGAKGRPAKARTS